MSSIEQRLEYLEEANDVSEFTRAIATLPAHTDADNPPADGQTS